ncbi:MAG: hypothetical protein H6Q72_3109 [Firmicutes bacterium]|nr:hypothetical protein [Bacillota bacterium]
MKISVQYCGGCNPVIDRSRIVAKLQSLLNNQIDISYDLDSDYDFLLVVDGCDVGCKGRMFAKDSKIVYVAGLLVQNVVVKNEEDIPKEIIRRLQEVSSV